MKEEQIEYELKTMRNSSGFAKLGITGALLKATAPPASTSRSRSRSRPSRRILQGATCWRRPDRFRQDGGLRPADPGQDHRARHQADAARRRARWSWRPPASLPCRSRRCARARQGRCMSRRRWCSAASRAISQVKKMAPGVDILVATPGRLTDLVRERRDQSLRNALAGARRGRPHARHGLHP